MKTPLVPTFNQKHYIKRQKTMMLRLTEEPDNKCSLLHKVIICYKDKPEWIMLCNANSWDS